MKALILLLLTGLFTGGVYIIGKLAVIDDVSALSVLVWQVCGGGVILWVVVLASGKRLLWDGQHIRYYLVGGLLGISLPFGLIYTVLEQVSVGLVGLITALTPMVTYVIARLTGTEAGSKTRLLGILAGLIGISIILMSRSMTASAEQWPYLLAALVIPLSLALSNVYRSYAWPSGSESLAFVSRHFINLVILKYSD